MYICISMFSVHGYDIQVILEYYHQLLNLCLYRRGPFTFLSSFILQLCPLCSILWGCLSEHMTKTKNNLNWKRKKQKRRHRLKSPRLLLPENCLKTWYGHPSKVGASNDQVLYSANPTKTCSRIDNIIAKLS